MPPKFENDPNKAARNLRDHGVSFEEAATTFFDTQAISDTDEAHSSPGDERYINIGKSTKERLLFVVHNEEDGVIRLISARVASPAQRELYEES